MALDPQIRKTWDSLYEIERQEILLDLVEQAAKARKETPSDTLRRLSAPPAPSAKEGHAARGQARLRPTFSPKIWQELDDLNQQVTAAISQAKKARAQQVAAARRRHRARATRIFGIPLAISLAILHVWTATAGERTSAPLRKSLLAEESKLRQSKEQLQTRQQDLKRAEDEIRQLEALVARSTAAGKTLQDLNQTLEQEKTKLAELESTVSRLKPVENQLGEAKAELGNLPETSQTRRTELEKQRARLTEMVAILPKLQMEGTLAEAQQEIQKAKQALGLPPGLSEAFIIPTEAKDAYGNPIRKGTDAKTGLPLEIRHKATGMHFVFIPAGEFVMGSPGNETGRSNDETQHTVGITEIPYLSKYETTQAEWRKVLDSNPSQFKGDSNPVETVSWDGCQELIKKLNSQFLGSGAKFRFALPTEAEWEYVCRAGTKTAYSWGNSFQLGKCNVENDEGSNEDKNVTTLKRMGLPTDSTVPVGKFEPNALGLYDMHGNVWEWCEDWYGEYPNGSVTDPKGPTGGRNRVYRGGGWLSAARDCRSANRFGNSPGDRDSSLGCRLALRSSP